MTKGRLIRKYGILIVLLVGLLSLFLVACEPGDAIQDSIYIRTIYTYNGTAWNVVNGGGITGETDPVFALSPAATITLADINSWDDHPTLTTGIHGVGVGNVVGTTLVQELTGKTLTGSVGKGTWTNSGVWKLPAMFFNGDITTDRWLSTSGNTFLGSEVIGSGNLAHTAGSEGYYNTAFGYRALHDITTSYFNVAVGAYALENLTTGFYNTALGQLALGDVITGDFNTAIGMQALRANTGSYNTALGMFAGGDNIVGDNNVFIGASAGKSELGSNKLYIDKEDTATPLIYGDFATNALFFYGSLKVGGAADYASIASDGTITLAGTARVEKDVEIPLSALGKGAAAPATVYLGNYIGYEYNINDTVYYCTEIPYDWDSTTDLEIEIHWYVNEAYALNNGEVRWNLIYTATKEDGSEAVDATTDTIDSGDINIPATAKGLVQTELTIPFAGLQAHDVIGVQIKRVALAGGTNPTAKPTVVGALVQYMSDRLGE